MIITTTVIIIHIFLGRIIVDEKIVMNFSPLHNHAGLTRAHRSEEWLPIPAVERPVVTRFATRGEHQVMTDLITASKASLALIPARGPLKKTFPKITDSAVFACTKK